MYRLHNIGIKAKLDWLIKNGKLLNKKIVIYPYGEDGMEIKTYINLKYGLKEDYILDDELCHYNSNIKPVSFIEEMENRDKYLFLVAIADPTDVIKKLVDYKINKKNIYFLKGDQLTSQDALIKCCEDIHIKTVLDVGGGKGNHSNLFYEKGKDVTEIDAGYTCELGENTPYNLIKADFLTYNFDAKYDLVWCAHVLEHQLQIGPFIKKLFECCKSEGKVAITVPDGANGRIIEGHVTLWNAGLLMYNIIQSGYSCVDASVKTYAGNVSVIVPKQKIENQNFNSSRIYLPKNLICECTRYGGIFFDGNIKELNW